MAVPLILFYSTQTLRPTDTEGSALVNRKYTCFQGSLHSNSTEIYGVPHWNQVFFHQIFINVSLSIIQKM
jgi:hypothetical protein